MYSIFYFPVRLREVYIKRLALDDGDSTVLMNYIRHGIILLIFR